MSEVLAAELSHLHLGQLPLVPHVRPGQHVALVVGATVGQILDLLGGQCSIPDLRDKNINGFLQGKSEVQVILGLSRGAVAQVVEHPSKGPTGLLQLY